MTFTKEQHRRFPTLSRRRNALRCLWRCACKWRSRWRVQASPHILTFHLLLCISNIFAPQIFLLLKYLCSSNISASQIPFLPRCRSRFARLSIPRESRSSRRWSARSTRPARRENQNQVRFVIFSLSQIAHIGFTYLKVLKYTHCQIKST